MNVAPAVALADVTVAFPTTRRGMAPVTAVQELSLTVPSGMFVTVIGPSGCGKSTLFGLLAGLIIPVSGSVAVHGASVIGKPGQVGYMPQRDLLLPWRTVLQNVTLGPELAQRGSAGAAHREARERLPVFGLEGFADVYPSALSGGMRQRAALLRTVLMERDVLLLDEPFGALDALTRAALQEWLLGVWAAEGQTVLFITHDVDEAVFLADRVVVMMPRPGRVRTAIDIPLPRPRAHADLVADPTFNALKAAVLAALGTT
ncbi:MAG: ABC transporter ATP-binding protein [Thermomicrobia bacterium]|nr:ABC transporter ATP-binding protein [Thermomicrobia bacterium]